MNRITKTRIAAAVMALLMLVLTGCGAEKEAVDPNAAEMHPLTRSEAQEVSPAAYDTALAIEKGLITENVYEKDYMLMQAGYMALLDHYLVLDGGLDGYQKRLDEAQCKFPAPEMDIYQKAGAFGRQNIAIRSNVYIENLSGEDLTLLHSGIKGLIFYATPELLDMVRRTAADVICVRGDGSAETFDAVYGEGITAPNTNLVLRITYAADEDEAVNAERFETAKAIAADMEKEMSERLGVGVTVLIGA